LPPHPRCPRSHKGSRGSLGILMPETGDGTQELPQKPTPVSTKGRRGRAGRSMPHVSNDSTSSRCRHATILVESDGKQIDGIRRTTLETKEGALIQEQAVQATEIARRAVTLAEDKQASNIVLLDLRRLNSVADYFVICTGGSERQLKAITEAIDEGLAREYDIQPRIEGTADTGWVLLDYGDVVVHIFSVELRDRYRLERLWSKATPVVVMQ
jgi:ribosome-associated protein